MKKDTIVQFICFITNLELNEFAPKWEQYAKRLLNSNSEPILQQKTPEAKNKYQYISQQAFRDIDVQLDFKNDKRSVYFPELNVKVVHAGGYIQLQKQNKHLEKEGETKIIAFLGHDENTTDFYSALPFYTALNIYQAYYESCTYSYVLEFFVPEKDAAELLSQLKSRQGIETGIYKECLVAHT